MPQHKDEHGWVYGVFCTERKDPNAPPGIAHTRDLKARERLPDLNTQSPQQRNVVLHPEFIDGNMHFTHALRTISSQRAAAAASVGVCRAA